MIGSGDIMSSVRTDQTAVAGVEAGAGAGARAEAVNFAARFRKAINLALPPDRRFVGNLSRVMGKRGFDRYRAVASGEATLSRPETEAFAAMMGVSSRWLGSGQGHPFVVGTVPLGDEPISLLAILAGLRNSGNWGPVQSIIFVACAYPAYGKVLIICEYEGTALNPHRYGVIRTTTALDAPQDGAWTWQPGALLLNMAFLSRLHVRRGGVPGQGMMSIIVSDDTYDALSGGTAHIRDLPLLVGDSTWHLDLLDRQRLQDPALVFQHFQYWQDFGNWTFNHLAKNPALGSCLDGYLRGDHPDFDQADALLDCGPGPASTLTRTPYLQRHPEAARSEPPPSGLLN
ncbi:hypothetical protein AruPA_17220 [Acidiphilium sp. PA]|uniref:hypothetical protein n=1 Tax=Acidiphilium sp. PA TaxID=2871705 RepID=UPI0022449BCE|nr:hypothetical protein [Acidiphilium sp. PA]MCW8308778.1 hypothetical protein [Acidiphilium sp. PA]